MLRKTLIVLAIASSLAACGKDAPKGAPQAQDNRPTKLIVAPEDIVTMQADALASGPVVTGSIEPERRADLRAEVSAIVLQVLKENGEPVKRGDVLVRLDETAIRDTLMSADASLRASTLALDQANRQLERLKTLSASGMTSAKALDDAEVARNNALSDVSAARSRVATARQQLARTVVRAPFDGIVSERKVSAGDTATIGKELVKVIDPNSMRFEGAISADAVSRVQVGQRVSFRVNGYEGQRFEGVLKRIDPTANGFTRQVEVLVGFTGKTQPLVAGLYAEGRIDSDINQALMLPERALVRAGDENYTWRIKDKKLSKVKLTVGARDERTGNFEITQGLAPGDVVLRAPGSNLKEGQIVDMPSARVASAAPVQGK